jgi:hypothetical protein
LSSHFILVFLEGAIGAFAIHGIHRLVLGVMLWLLAFVFPINKVTGVNVAIFSLFEEHV